MGKIGTIFFATKFLKAVVTKGDQVRAAYTGYTGPRPKMMIWHGTA
jgi:acetylxylan esterase